MGWPQYFILVVLVFGVLNTAWAATRRREMSSGTAALAIMFSVAWTLFYTFVLHAGGFW